MMPICQYRRRCRKVASLRTFIGEIDAEIGGYSDIYLCEKHKKKIYKLLSIEEVE